MNLCSLGYREPYLYNAAKQVRDGDLELESLLAPRVKSCDAIQQLVRLHGVGIKVAQCTALFGMGHTDLFPVDVWIERAILRQYIDYDDIAKFGEYSGLVQQYIYNYMIKAVKQ